MKTFQSFLTGRFDLAFQLASGLHHSQRRKGTENNAFHYTENGSVRSNAESEGEDGNGGEARRLSQHAKAVADILN
jgi:hypothetical protein